MPPQSLHGDGDLTFSLLRELWMQTPLSSAVWGCSLHPHNILRNSRRIPKELNGKSHINPHQIQRKYIGNPYGIHRALIGSPTYIHRNQCRVLHISVGKPIANPKNIHRESSYHQWRCHLIFLKRVEVSSSSSLREWRRHPHLLYESGGATPRFLKKV